MFVRPFLVVLLVAGPLVFITSPVAAQEKPDTTTSAEPYDAALIDASTPKEEGVSPKGERAEPETKTVSEEGAALAPEPYDAALIELSASKGAGSAKEPSRAQPKTKTMTEEGRDLAPEPYDVSPIEVPAPKEGQSTGSSATDESGDASSRPKAP